MEWSTLGFPVRSTLTHCYSPEGGPMDKALLTNPHIPSLIYSYDLGVLHLNGTHLRWQSSASLAPQRVTDPHSPLLVWSTDKGSLGG